MDEYEFPYKGKPIDSLVVSALAGKESSQVTLAEFYAAGYQVKQNFNRAYSWAFVASKNGHHAGDSWEKKIWLEFKSDAERREALIQANDLWNKILEAARRG